MRSLHSRLLLAASLVLAGFIGATGLALDKAFRVSAEASMQERLQSYIYALLDRSADLAWRIRFSLTAPPPLVPPLLPCRLTPSPVVTLRERKSVV